MSRSEKDGVSVWFLVFSFPIGLALFTLLFCCGQYLNLFHLGEPTTAFEFFFFSFWVTWYTAYAVSALLYKRLTVGEEDVA